MNKEDEKIYNLFCMEKQLAKGTKKSYKQVLKQYIKATGMTLQELYDEAIQEEDERVPLYRKKSKTHILEFQAYLDDKEDLHDSSKRFYIKVIKSFYDAFNIPLPKIHMNYSSTPDPDNVKYAVCKKMIKMMVDVASPRNKAIISFMAMTGQAQMEVINLTLQQVVDAWNTELENPIFAVDDIFQKKNEILEIDACHIYITRQKTKKHNKEYITFLPRETSNHILTYLDEREHSRNTKIRIKDLNSPLFVTKMGNKMSPGAITKEYDHIGRKCGFENPEQFEPELRLLLQRKPGQHRVYKSHNMRKYFINVCKKYAGNTNLHDTTFTGLELADYWVGHTPRGSIKSYIQTTNEDYELMKKQYLQALPYLSLETEMHIINDAETKNYEQLKEKHEELEKELADIKEFLNYQRLKEKFMTKA